MTINSKEVIIVGGSFAGILAAKALLGSKKNVNDLKLNITLISPSESAFFNIASPRVIFEQNKADSIFFDLEKTLQKYAKHTSHTVKFVKGFVEHADLEEQSILVSNGSTLKYDNLIIASGNRSVNPAFKLDNQRDSKFTIESIKKLGQQIKAAKSIAVIGGGATGVELAGEIAFNYGTEKEITLFTGSSQPIPALNKSYGDKATKQLEGLHVKVVNNKKAKSYDDTTVEFNDGKVQTFGLVIPVHKYTPNTEYLPKEVLDKDGYVVTDENYRLKKYHNVIAVGDVLSMGSKSVVDLAYGQKAGVENTIDYEVFGNTSVTLKNYKKLGTILLVPISKNGGVGTAFGLPFPNFLVRTLKAKDFMISKAGENLS
ncbi:uncharacterized protein RJT20DRAFT_127544 [Scheffersomyces xylosifermentans]|uniref:uncharacterized protein n=1 Tax=Scheffersomyces xylosifermentans TaxID=1304137 RepID=UPI00315D8BBA